MHSMTQKRSLHNSHAIQQAKISAQRSTKADLQGTAHKSLSCECFRAKSADLVGSVDNNSGVREKGAERVFQTLPDGDRS